MFLPFGVAFLLSLVFLPLYIKWLKHLQIGQFIREEGPASHAIKAKTPTMGGIIFILATLFSWALFCVLSQNLDKVSLAVIVLAFICALIGLSDDIFKFMNKANRGLSAAKRLILEAVFGAAFGFVLIHVYPVSQHLLLSPPSSSHPINYLSVLPYWVIILLSTFLIAATVNAVNLHDGMDGLAAGTLFPVFLSLSLMLIKIGDLPLALIALSAAGALAAFLIFNCYPAKIFMGDVGSLFLGGLLAALILSSGLTLWFIPLSVIYILETISVLVQVSWFKLTKSYTPAVPTNKLSLAVYKLTHRLPGEGKRVFRMAPLHHHFEAVWAEKGVTEWQVVLGFWIVQLLICCIVLTAFFRF